MDEEAIKRRKKLRELRDRRAAQGGARESTASLGEPEGQGPQAEGASPDKRARLMQFLAKRKRGGVGRGRTQKEEGMPREGPGGRRALGPGLAGRGGGQAAGAGGNLGNFPRLKKFIEQRRQSRDAAVTEASSLEEISRHREQLEQRRARLQSALDKTEQELGEVDRLKLRPDSKVIEGDSVSGKKVDKSDSKSAAAKNKAVAKKSTVT